MYVGKSEKKKKRSAGIFKIQEKHVSISVCPLPSPCEDHTLARLAVPKEDEIPETELGHPSHPSQDHRRPGESQTTPKVSRAPQKCEEYLL